MMPGGGREWPPRPRNERRPGPPDGRDPNEPYPDVRGAFMLTLFAMLAAAFTGIFFIDFGMLAAVGVGQAIGVGAVATLAAQRVPEPQAKRLGLRALDPAIVPAILCLVPAILLVSEADNFARDWFGDGRAESATELLVPTQPDMDAGGDGDFGQTRGGSDLGRGVDTDSGQSFGRETLYDYERRFDSVEEPGDGYIEPDGSPESSSGSGDAPGVLASSADSDAEAAKKIFDPNDPFSLLQAFIVLVGISPIVEEFLFRGVIQQGMIARLGLLRGVSLAALMWTLLRPAPITTAGRFVVTAVASFALGWALGVVRVASGSILGPILLAALWSAVGLGALAFEGSMDLPGMNVEGTHLPMGITLASLVLVAWSGSALFRQAEAEYAQDELYQQSDSENGDSGAGAGGDPTKDPASTAEKQSNVVGHKAWGTDLASPDRAPSDSSGPDTGQGSPPDAAGEPTDKTSRDTPSEPSPETGENTSPPEER
jgi:membrane protease YdiL (CAAX protease family)